MTPDDAYLVLVVTTVYLLMALWAMDPHRKPCWIDWCWWKVRNGVAWALGLPGRGTRRLMSALSPARTPPPCEERVDKLRPMGQARWGDVQDTLRRP